MRLFRLVSAIAIPFLAILVATTLQASANAQDAFERELRAAYADYRAVLFHSNTNNMEATAAAVSAFSSKWNVLADKYKSPPARYADDAAWTTTFAAVADTIAKGKTLAEQNNLSDAHEVFEKIRDFIEDLHTRNGIVTFSVRMNAFHHQMEEVLKKKYEGFSGAGLGELREDAAVLNYLLQQLRTFPPEEAKANAQFDAALNATFEAVGALQAASRSADGAKSKEALSKLKPAYARLFLRFG